MECNYLRTERLNNNYRYDKQKVLKKSINKAKLKVFIAYVIAFIKITSAQIFIWYFYKKISLKMS